MPPLDIEKTLRGANVKPVMPHPLTAKNAVRIDLSRHNTDKALQEADTVDKLQAYIDSHLARGPYLYVLGGYGEDRAFYNRFTHFQGQDKPRTFHLGIDIWTAARTPVMAPLRGEVHSLANNNRPGDYGGTLILSHKVGKLSFHSLYGHLDPASIAHFATGDPILAGQKIAELGDKKVNVQWPPHLHFQLILDMEGKEGDYPGVVQPSEGNSYLKNCPHPEWILRPKV